MNDYVELEVGDIVKEINYIAYFHDYQEPLIGIIIDICDVKQKYIKGYKNQLAKVYWFKNKKFEMMPIYLLIPFENNGKEYECEKI